MSDDIARFTDTDPDARPNGGPDAELDSDELDLEAPENDVAEQRAEVLQHDDEPIVARPGEPDWELDIEANPADAVEQRRVVVVDEEDDYH